jgi:SAM-dependent methyltransferase
MTSPKDAPQPDGAADAGGVGGALVTALDAWLEAPLGQRLLSAEQAEVRAALEDVFGNQFLQIGHWGRADTFLPLARTPRRALVAEPGASGHCVSHAASLAILSQSVDAVLLPHTLEFEPEPQAVLREVERVLVGEGRVLVLGFEPHGAFAVRHYLATQGFPPGLVGLLSRGRLRDWLTLLGFEVGETRRFVHALPLATLEAGALNRGLERLGRRLGGRLGSVYLLKARKRVYTLTPIRPRRRPAPKLAGAVVEPT